ncbi:MAG: hypothetical protein KUA35_06295 [Pseudodesulfovibrio sp.]|nr:hypothetical protein [Pseudomonadota bacterium]MBU4523261.1 hypothetical protein [Pseudomonadota bacterium]MBV1772023.1 hypothetical protein [Pseudodesulfovibrio sp.]MCG2732171.1 hypothetical protein [Pseudodesulfovibrio aespoeensis]
MKNNNSHLFILIFRSALGRTAGGKTDFVLAASVKSATGACFKHAVLTEIRL